MNHRIAAGAIVEHDGRLVLVRHIRTGRYDFWVAPGGGVYSAETLNDAVVREVPKRPACPCDQSALLVGERGQVEDPS